MRLSAAVLAGFMLGACCMNWMLARNVATFWTPETIQKVASQVCYPPKWLRPDELKPKAIQQNSQGDCGTNIVGGGSVSINCGGSR